MTDVFLPRANAIILGQRTFYKSDPSFWAVAAHELGHVVIRHRLPVLGRLLSFARIGGGLFAASGLLLLLVNILYGSATLARWGLRGYAVALGLQVVVLLEEFLASTHAMRFLREDSRLGPTELRGAFVTLVAGFGTYVGEFIGRLIVLAQGEHFTRLLVAQRQFRASGAVDGFNAGVLFGLLLVLGLSGVLLLKSAIKPPVLSANTRNERDVLMVFLELLVLWFVWLVWDYTDDPRYIMLVAFACFAMRRVLKFAVNVAALPLGLLLLFITLPLIRLAQKLSHGEESEAFERAQHGAEGEITKSKAEFANAEAALERQTSWEYRLGYAADVAFVPLLLAYCLW
jgi:Zn-dependent membrane protease YugP